MDTRMIDAAGRQRISTLVIDHVRAAAGETRFVAIRDFTLERAGIVVDLAIAADELIGVVIRGAGDTIDNLAQDSAACRRYFDRVLAVVDASHISAARGSDLAGATLWAVHDRGVMREHVSGTKNIVGPAALFEMMTRDQRARLIRPMIPQGTSYQRRSVVPA